MKVLVPLIAVTLAFGAGCGGGSPSKTAAPKAGTHAAFVQEANQICKQMATRVPRFPGERDKNGGLKTTAGQVIPYLQDVSQVSRQTLRQIGALTAPEADRAKVAALLTAQRGRISTLEDALAAAQKGDGRRFTAAVQRDQRIAGPRYVRAAAQLGLTACR